MPTVLDYSTPLAVPTANDLGIPLAPPAPADAAAIPEPVNPPANDANVRQAGEYFDNARAAFRDGNYAQAQQLDERAIALTPGDPNLHQFRALTMFAQGRYQNAAGALYAVLAAGPGWDWQTLSTFYANPDTYTGQLRALENFERQNPSVGYAHFLLAYHYLAIDARDAAATQLKKVVRLVPGDRLSASLLKALTEPQPQAPQTVPPTPGSP
jgi:tetratricopeptide (TPR) repeat protein